MENNSPCPLLGGISKEQFLSEYWQKKPLLIRNALANFTSPCSADELAGLACEEGVESRIVLEKGGKYPWELRDGPFEEEDFATLPETHWTLLLQEANKQIPELASLLDHFDFIPSWWLDDIMISYAPDQGTVGPHYDRYDVFLLQVEGKKSWKINTQPVEDDNFIDDIQLRIMKTFECEYEWVLEPGDMLYLPPGVAHYGIAMGESLTYSIGYRALSQSELFSSYFDFVLEKNSGKRHFSDPALSLQKHPSEISSDTIKQLTSLLKEMPLDAESISRWFGCFITEPRTPTQQLMPPEKITPKQFINRLKTSNITRSEQSRFNFTAQKNGGINLYVDGEEYLLNSEQARFGYIICENIYYNHQQLSRYVIDHELLDFLLQWINDGTLYFSDGE